MAKSIIYIRITGPLNPFSNNVKSGDWLGINLLLNGVETLIHEAPTVNRTVQGAWIQKKNETEDSAKRMIQKMSQDWRNVGGANNVKVWYTDEPPIPLAPGHYMAIELQNPLWTFGTTIGQAFSNGKAVVAMLSNVPPPTPKTVTLTQTNTVDCSNKRITYGIAITGGTAPYTVQGTATGTVPSPGTSNIQLIRGLATNIVVRDSLGVEIGRKLLTPVISLENSYFNISVSQDGASPLAVVTPNVELPSELFPIDYSLDDSTYQGSGNFPDLDFEETYTVYIRDKFGCKVSKTFVTPKELEGVTEEENYKRVFQISNAGTLLWKKLEAFSTTVKKNFTNTLSCEEMSLLAYSYVQEFDDSDLIVSQFKSSYDFHKVTLLTDNGPIELFPVMQSQNMRLVEKVDAKLFRDPDGALGIYFRNGNKYIEGTDTPNGENSPYDDMNLPSWARFGATIRVDGIGTVKIKRIKTDPTRGLYVQTDTGYFSVTDDDGRVQANYDRQDYNTYEFGMLVNSIPNGGFGQVIIEAGFNDLVEVTAVSERIKRIKDSNQYYLIQWSDPENKANIVHQTGITHFARMMGSLMFLTKSNSETERSDSGAINLRQEAYRTAVLKLAVYGHGMENKLHLASGMENFQINGINYRKTKMESEYQGASNIYIIESEFEAGGNQLGTNVDELVLKEPLTGITAKPSIPETIPSFLDVGGSTLLLNGAGGFVRIEGD